MSDNEEVQERVEVVNEDGRRTIAYLSTPEVSAANERVLAMTAEERQRVIDDFNSIYYHGLAPAIQQAIGHSVPMHTTMAWRGVKAEKFPTDLWLCQEIISHTRPEVIVECGVRNGGATLFYSDVLAAECGWAARVIGVDIDTSVVDPRVAVRPNVSILRGSSIDPAIADIVSVACAGKRTMVILDSEHTYDHVREELRLYAPLVSKDCSLIVEDTVCAGVMRAALEFLHDNREEFAVDVWAHRLMVTQSKNGFMIRTAEPQQT